MKRAAWIPVLTFTLASLALAGDEAELKTADVKLQKLIDDAIDRGAKWLLDQQNPSGEFPAAYGSAYPMGPTALATLALLHSGIPRESEAVKMAFGFLRRQYDRARTNPRTYSVSVTIMALAEYGRVRRAVRKEDTRYGGAATGGLQLTEPDLEWLKELVRWLVSVQRKGGAWHYPNGGYDHSNSQYALLALKEARRVGIEVPEEVFARALAHFLRFQESNGKKVARYEESGGDGVYAAQRARLPGFDRARGWAYTGPGFVTGGMTAAGVAAVAICGSELTEPRYRKIASRAEQSMRDGLAWLGEKFSVRENPQVGFIWHYYYLYSLERAGVLSRRVYMGKHRWYPEGAKFLVDGQSPLGFWRSGMLENIRGLQGPVSGGDIVDQSFALLFLARATARALGVATEDPLLDLSTGERLADEELEKLFDAAVAEMARLSDSQAKDRARDFALLGPRVIGLLLPGLSSPEESVRGGSVTILRAVTGLAHGFDPAASREKREAAADRWTTWYLLNRARLTLDRTARRIR